MAMNVWVGLGLGIVIGMLLGVLGAALLFLRRVQKAPNPIAMPELALLRTERDTLRIERDAVRAEADQHRADADLLRTDVATMRTKQTSEALARQSLEMELAMVKPMVARASAEKDTLLMDVIGLRSENEKLQEQIKAATQVSIQESGVRSQE
jgi:uncharacterized protein (DUF3084 family)